MYLQKTGFTIVELLIVIVVIGVLGAFVLNSFSQAQTKARNAKIDNDLAVLRKTILNARTNSGTNMISITQNGATESGCMNKASGTDLASLPQTDSCWSAYNTALDRLSTAAGTNIRDMKDPWGRPYYVNANEGENQTTHLCMTDFIGTYAQPFVTNGINARAIPLYSASC